MVWLLLLALLAGPAAPYCLADQAQDAALKQDFESADLVFRASIAAITLAEIGVGPAAASVPMFNFENMEILKGGKPKWTSFIFEHLPEGAAFSRGSKVVVFLKKAAGGEEYRISGMMKLTPESESVLEGFSKPAVNNI